MEESQKSQTRKKFLLGGAVLLASATILKLFTRTKEKKSDTVKMLTQDGRLVEIDKKLLAAPGKKVTNDELQHWIKK